MCKAERPQRELLKGAICALSCAMWELCSVGAVLGGSKLCFGFKFKLCFGG